MRFSHSLRRTLPRFHEAKIDLHVLAFTTFAAVLAGVLVGVWPAWRISNSESISLALHEAGGRSASDGLNRQRMRSGLVIMQAALAIVLLAGAGLTLKSFWHAQNAPLGFEPHGVVNFEISLPDREVQNRRAEGTRFGRNCCNACRAFPASKPRP